MSATTPREDVLGNCRKQLEVLVDRLSGGVAQLTVEAQRPVGAETAASTAGGNEGDEEVARSVLLSEEQILSEAQAALARFDAGTFGKCQRCGRAVARTRLAAVPYARNCIKCARAAEAGQND
ncbi:TraR/DksA family transcriptional regulator [Gemmata sp. JC717]|uniref:TraR/DksA family transcriptional regulator n=1 Tax=Gemmata algarum TaxID=2975278 RepID=A0ABU5EVZ6_9BACT|nr:TraR/DksA family transcriptional regulator [Gemmata algarum]MDY3554493.1 TraR/DksA family transcriptional regulator [Gemmata algarum]MDY3559144.1 TraR/DksA family transcriptional regulator [Gemmata algarum]